MFHRSAISAGPMSIVGNPALGSNVTVGADMLWKKFISANFLYLGIKGTENAGKLFNTVPGSTDWLTIIDSTPGAETYQCPNTAPYIAADTDYIWFKTNQEQRTTTTAELKGYDLPRTPIKFDDYNPCTLRWIGILKPNITLNQADLNLLTAKFELPINVVWRLE